jgi:hypothetical protein
MEVGERFAPLEFVLTRELNEQYLYAVEDYSGIYIDEEDSVAHPGLLLNMSNNTRSSSFHLPQGWAEIHAAEETEYRNPARVGKRLTVSWEVVEKFEKRGRPWHVLDIRITDEDGLEILRRKMTNTFAAPKLT